MTAAGQGLRVPCHFGEWVQGRLGADGPVALITLSPKSVALKARRSPSRDLAVVAPGLPAGFPRPLGALRPFLRALDLPVSGRFHLDPPFPPGLGTGASTAGLLAIARLQGYRGGPARLAGACLAAEGAVDPLMFPAPDRLLWASRQARVLATLPPVPRAHLLTGFFGPPLPTQATDTDYANVSDLLDLWARAGGLSTCAELASESARRCLALRGPAQDPMADLARALGALGWAMSHSGAARALIFAPGGCPAHGPQLLREAGLRGVRHMVTGDV